MRSAVLTRRRILVHRAIFSATIASERASAISVRLMRCSATSAAIPRPWGSMVFIMSSETHGGAVRSRFCSQHAGLKDGPMSATTLSLSRRAQSPAPAGRVERGCNPARRIPSTTHRLAASNPGRHSGLVALALVSALADRSALACLLPEPGRQTGRSRPMSARSEDRSYPPPPQVRGANLPDRDAAHSQALTNGVNARLIRRPRAC